MSDCPNAEIRDLLPDLLHDRLDAPTRARVLAHVDGCADCRSELELLRSLRGSLERGTPLIDVERVVTALPKPSTVQVRRRRVWSDWRIAAAVTFIVAGGTSVVVMRNVRDGGAGSPDSASVRIPPMTAETTALAPRAVTDSQPSMHRGETTPAPARSQRGTTPGAPSNPQAVAANDDPAAAAALGNRIGNLNEKQLKSLLNEIDHMEATPIIDPEPVVLRVGARATSPTGL
jgi:hypothetical protein